MVGGKVCQHFAVEIDVVFVKFPHKFRIGHTMLSGGSFDTDYPKRAEITLFGFKIGTG